MWTILKFFSSLLFLLFIIDQTLCAPKPGKKTDKIHSLNSLCNILNYGELDNHGVTTHTVKPPNEKEPIKVYQTGHNNRVEYVRAVITVQTIKSRGSVTNPAARRFARAMGKLTDDAGHIIGNRLGGTGKKLFNIFPQSPNINRGAWSKEEKTIQSLVMSSKQPIEIIVQLYYPSPKATRPTNFRYRAAYGNACHSASVVNP